MRQQFDLCEGVWMQCRGCSETWFVMNLDDAQREADKHEQEIHGDPT